MIRRWEKGGGVSERYQLHYCRTFQIPPPPHFGGMPGSGEGDDHEAIRFVFVFVLSK